VWPNPPDAFSQIIVELTYGCLSILTAAEGCGPSWSRLSVPRTARTWPYISILGKEADLMYGRVLSSG
jgi:hypothetical protein